ncbi:MAG: hypothetical protein COZ57_04355, partial [Armatimonadetes bacterium CG_4_8_14_3_um_filter_66_20]
VWENTLCPTSAARLPGKFRELPLRCLLNLRGYIKRDIGFFGICTPRLDAARGGAAQAGK